MEEPISWNIIFTSLQMQERFLKPILGGLIKIRDESEIARSARDYIDMLNIKCLSENQRVQDLSGGNQQKGMPCQGFQRTKHDSCSCRNRRGVLTSAPKEWSWKALRKYNDEFGTTIVMVSSNWKNCAQSVTG